MFDGTFRRFIAQSLLIATTFLVTTFSVSEAAEKPITIAFNENWPPFSYRDEHNEMKGILVDIVKEVFQTKLNQPVEFFGYPWKRVQRNVEVGVHDGFVTTATPGRLTYSERSSEAVYTLEEKAFINKNSKHRDVFSALTPETVILLQNYAVCDMIGNGWAINFYGSRNIKVKHFKDINLCFRNVAFNRYDIVIHVSAAGLSLIKKEGLHDKLEMLPTVFDEVPFPLMLSKKSEHLAILPAFDKAIREFKAEGGIDRIVDRYTK